MDASAYDQALFDALCVAHAAATDDPLDPAVEITLMWSGQPEDANPANDP